MPFHFDFSSCAQYSRKTCFSVSPTPFVRTMQNNLQKKMAKKKWRSVHTVSNHKRETHFRTEMQEKPLQPTDGKPSKKDVNFPLLFNEKGKLLWNRISVNCTKVTRRNSFILYFRIHGTMRKKPFSEQVCPSQWLGQHPGIILLIPDFRRLEVDEDVVEEFSAQRLRPSVNDPQTFVQ